MFQNTAYRYCAFLILLLFICTQQLHAAETPCRVLDPDIADEYQGDCKDGLADGHGIAKGRDTYEGDFREGKPHGEGKYAWFNGDVYKGSWVEGRRNGWGVLRRPNGSYYEGEWKDGKRHGNGKYKWQDGAYYEGEWQNDERHGVGIYYGKDNSYYKGEWQHGLQHGRGLYKWPDGTYIKGRWNKGEWVKEEKRKVTVILDQHIFDILEKESQKTGESISKVISRSVECLDSTRDAE